MGAGKMVKYGNGSKKSVSAVATKAANRAINRRAELKHLPSNYSLTLSTTSSVDKVTGVPQGDTDLTRDGDQIEMKSLSIGYQVTTGDPNNIVRLTFIQWFATSVPTVSEIFSDTSTIGLLMGGFAQDYRRTEQFKVLKDILVVVNSYSPNVCGKFNIKNMRKRLGFLSGGTNGAGHIYYIMTSDSSAISHPTAQIASHLSFYDF